jgi:hypothetical protein
MEIRKTLILFFSVVLVFCSFFIGTNYLINSEEALQAGDLNLVPDTTTTTVNSSLSAEENIVIIDTTTTTVIKNIPEEDGVIEDKQIIGQSDGASITPTDMAIFQSEEDSAILNSLNNTDINEGCLNKSNEEVRKEQWQIFSSLNTYKENSLNINLKIENSLNMDIDCLANLIFEILNDDRGWKTVVNKNFQFTNESRSDFSIVFASPETVDELCFPLQTNGIYSCRVADRVVINFFRWVSGAKDFGTDLATYRLYLINHEVGHMLGWGHTNCPAEGALAPLMMQQSITTDSCLPYGWPTYERINNIFNLNN